MFYCLMQTISVADPVGVGGGALGASAPTPEPSMKKSSTFPVTFLDKGTFSHFWGLLSSLGNWQLHKVTPLSIPQSYYSFDTSGSKMVCFEDQYIQ